MFSSSDDSAMMKQVVGTHSPDGRDVELEPILKVIEDTLHHAIPANIDGVIHVCTILCLRCLCYRKSSHFDQFDYKRVGLGQVDPKWIEPVKRVKVEQHVITF